MATLTHLLCYAREVTSISSPGRMRPSSGSSGFAASTVCAGSSPESSSSSGSCGERGSSSFSTLTTGRRRSSGARPNTRRCGFPECQKTAKRGGLCISHGGGKKCSVEGCTTSVVSRGFCVAHGGGKRCQYPDCTKSAQTGGFCWIHGGGKKCGYLGCKKRAQSGGACISHGGGKRCRMEGCNKVVQYDGLCVGHGGYRKCLSLNCDKRALANSYCLAHGGNSLCRVPDCRRRAVRGGLCTEHKAQMPLRTATGSTTFACSRPSIDLPRSQDMKFKTEPNIMAFSPPDKRWTYRRTPTTARNKSPSELRGATAYSCVDIPTDVDSPPGDVHVISPLQYVRRSSLSSSTSSTMVTPICQHFNAVERYGQQVHQNRNFPLLPGFNTLQSNRVSPPRSKERPMEWSSSSAMSFNLSDQRMHCQSQGVEYAPNEVSTSIQSRPDELVVSLGNACNPRTCRVACCSRHAKRNGLCLLHCIVSVP